MEVIDIQKQIKSKQLNNFYIFTGEEIAVQSIYINKIAEVSNLEICRCDTVTEIIPRIHSKSFLKQSRCYVIHNDLDYFKAQSAWNKVVSSIGNNILILIYDSIDKRSAFYKQYKDEIVTFEHLSETVLTKYIQKQIDLTDENCRKLIDVCEYDYSRILLEIDKIQNFEARPNLYPNSIFELLLKEGVIYKPPKDAIFNLVDSVCRGYINKAFELYEDCKAINESPLAIISVLYNNMKQILQVQSCQSKDICKSTGLTPYQIKLAKEKMGAYSIGELVKALKTIQRVEKGIKCGEIPQERAVDYLLINIMR